MANSRSSTRFTSPRFGTTPRIPLTGFSVFGLLTFWAYTAAELALLLREHFRARWREFGAQLEQAGVPPDEAGRWRRQGFDDRIAVPVVAAVLYGLSGTIIVIWCIRWLFFSADIDQDLDVIMEIVSTAAALFYAATCLLVIWTSRRIHAHEVSELAIRERGTEIASGDPLVPDEAMVTRWEQINNHVSLFLIVSFAIVGSPVVAAHLFLTGATANYAGLPALACFVLCGVFHFWGTRLLLGMFNDHLGFEAAHLGGRQAATRHAADGGSRSTSPSTPPAAPDEGIEPYSGTESFIFVSYKREDYERIRPVLKRVRNWGYRVWYDKGIPGGAEWDALIEDRLKRCGMLLFFVSRGSVESKYCRREVKYVDHLNKPILSLRLEPAELGHGLEMLLTQYQMIEASAPDFTGEIERALKYLRLL